MTELSERVYLNKSTVSGIVFRMFQKKWVNVERFEDDRRRLKITLTDEGRNIVKWLEVSQIWNIFAPLNKLASEKVKLLRNSLKELVDYLDLSQPSSEEVLLSIEDHNNGNFEKIV